MSHRRLSLFEKVAISDPARDENVATFFAQRQSFRRNIVLVYQGRSVTKDIEGLTGHVGIKTRNFYHVVTKVDS